MILIRKSEERGHSSHGWLESRHSFSFGEYLDPDHMGFGPLRVINDDRVMPGTGFGRHPHRDMEIISYVVEGSLAHQDSLGNESTLRQGDVQRMSAGTGVLHSEFNPSEADAVHFLQIWILPGLEDLPPSYEQKHFSRQDKLGRLRLIASHDGREGSLGINQDADVYATVLEGGQSVTHPVGADRMAYLHVVKGVIRLGEIELSDGDGARIALEPSVTLSGEGEALLFDMRA